MSALLLGAGALVLLATAVGLGRVLRGPSDADRMLAAQLLGTGGIAVILLVAAALDEPAAVDVALVAALLAAFASIAFATARGRPREDSEPR